MKTIKSQTLKNILLCLLSMLAIAPSMIAQEAQSELSAVDGKRRWLMGYECQTEKTYDVLWKESQEAAFNGTRIYNDLKLTSNGTSSVLHTPTYMYGKSGLILYLKVLENGKLTVEAQQCTSGGKEGGSGRTVTIKLGTTTLGTMAFNKKTETQTYTIDVTGVTDENNTIEISTNDHLRWYSIKWLPASAPKVTPTLTLNIPESQRTMTVDDDIDLAATLSYDGTTINTSAITYSSDNTNVATIENGKLKAVGGGTVNVKASFAGDDDYNACESAQIAITVNKKNLDGVLKVDGVEATGPVNITVGQLSIVTVDYSYEGAPVDINSNFGMTPNGIVGFAINANHGHIVGLKEGEVTIKVYSSTNSKIYNSKYNSITYTVSKATPEIKTDGGAAVTNLGGATLGLGVETPVDVNGRFKVYFRESYVVNEGNGVFNVYTRDTDITSQGTITYSSENLTIDGTTLSSATARSDGQLTITWTPTGDAADKYESVTTTLNNIEVANPALKDLVMTVSPTAITVKVNGTYSTPITAQYTYEGATQNLTTTYASNDASIATVDASGHVTGVKAGTTKITVTFAGDDVYNPASSTVDVTVEKKDLTITAAPASITNLEENTSAAITVSFSPSVTLPVTYTSADKVKATVSATGVVTGAVQGSTTITVKFEGNDEYNPCETTVAVTVTDNPMFEYLGYKLAGNMTGDLKDHSKPAKTLMHYKFGAPENTDLYVFKLNTKKDRYEFANDKLQLKSSSQDCENPFDNFHQTKLTENGGGGDAFTEYNGMMGGYGTEGGGRYLTPIGGTFIRAEPLYDGIAIVTLRHNGGTDNSSFSGDVDDIAACTDIRVARRPLYVMDEDGKIMQRTSNYEDIASGDAELTSIDGTYAEISTTSKVNDRFNVINQRYSAWLSAPTDESKSVGLGKGFDHNFSKNAFSFIKNVIYKDLTDFSVVKKDYVQRLYYSAAQTDVEYQDDNVSEQTNFFAKYGYEVLSATQLRIAFPVKAGKTYFVGANKSKVGLCTIEFVRTQPETTVPTYELDEEADETPGWIKSTATNTTMNVKVKRTFQPGQWHPLVLPFSVSESTLKEVFGEKVSVIALDGSLKMLSSKNNYATRDAANAESADGRPFTGSVIKDPAVKDGSVTFTRHYYQMIYANCPVFICPDPDLAAPVKDHTFTNVTFVKPTLTGPDEAIQMPYEVDRQIGDGDVYHYSMVAMYHATTSTENKDKEMYYVGNTGTGKNAVATLYHAEKGKAPAMKGMRVWIEPAANRYTPPLRTIKMADFCGSAQDDYEFSGIEDIICDTPVEALVGDDTVYDISGRAVGHGTIDDLAPGLYIFQGRKYYVKQH